MDPEVLKVADKLAAFVAANGRSFENITKERNLGDTPFKCDIQANLLLFSCE